MNTSIVVLGSNVEPEKNIHLAKQLISQKFQVLNESRFLKTKPVGLMDQPDFINGALLIQTRLDCESFRADLKGIESQMGRTAATHHSYGPRVIDIDILVWNDRVVNQDFYEREFVRNFVFELLPAVKY